MSLADLAPEAVAKGELRAGAAAVVTSDSEAIFLSEGIDAHTLFGIGSITKLLTAITLVRLEERGMVDLDQPVTTLVKGYSFRDHRFGPLVTTRHLLSHSSGLPAAGRDWGPREATALARFAHQDLAHYRFLAPPGSFHCYSNTAFSLAGLVVEMVTGTSFPEALAAEVLVPAGMNDAHFPPVVDSEHFSGPGSYTSEGIWAPSPRVADNPAGYPSGFLLASLDDLINFSRSLLEHSLLSPDELGRLSSEVISRHIRGAGSPLAQASAGYGLGCYVGRFGAEPVFRHGGMQQSYNCSIDIFPRAQAVSVLLTNGCEDVPFSHLLTASYARVAGPVVAPPVLSPPEQLPLPAFHGIYLDVAGGQQVDINGTTPLRPLGEGHFLSGSTPVWFPRGEDPAPYLVAWGTPYLRWQPSPSSDIPVTAGLYRDSFYPDPSSDITISIHGEQVLVTMDGEPAIGRMMGSQALLCAHGLIEFSVDGSSLQLGRATIYERS